MTLVHPVDLVLPAVTNLYGWAAPRGLYGRPEVDRSELKTFQPWVHFGFLPFGEPQTSLSRHV